MEGLRSLAAASISESNSFTFDSENKKQIAAFMPRLLKHNEAELYCYKIGDLLKLLQGYAHLWKAQVVTDEDFA